jgi:hypothetical protein
MLKAELQMAEEKVAEKNRAEWSNGRMTQMAERRKFGQNFWKIPKKFKFIKNVNCSEEMKIFTTVL